MRNRTRLAVALLALGLAFVLSAPVLDAQTIDMDQARAAEELRWGVGAFHLGLFGEAILAFERSLSLQPNAALSRNWLGRAYERAGFTDLAVDQWRWLLASGRGSPLIERAVDTLELRHGVGAELRPAPSYVHVATLSAQSDQMYPFRRPSAITARADGSVYVTAFGSQELVVLDANGAVTDVLRGGLDRFQQPFDVVSVGDALYVSEYGANRITRLRANGRRQLSFGAGGPPGERLLGPQYLAADQRGYLYVTDWGNRRVVKFDLDGRYVLDFGRADGQFRGLLGPSGVVVDGEVVYVADRVGGAIVAFDTSGNRLREIRSEQLTGPEGLTLLGPGRMLIADGSRVLELDADQERFAVIEDSQRIGRRLIDVARTANGDLLIADFDGSSIHILTDLADLTGGLFARIMRVDASAFPEVTLEIAVEDPYGHPLLGLSRANFAVSEGRVPIADVELLSSPASRLRRSDAVILLEGSVAAREVSIELDQALGQLVGDLTGSGSLRLITAATDPVDHGAANDPSLRITGALAELAGPSWRFDRGLRLAATSLLGSRSNRAVVFVGTGTLPADAFRDYSLRQLADFLVTNHIALFPVSVTSQMAPELVFLAEQTGGAAFLAPAPQGLTRLAPALLERQVPVYALRYRSSAETDFGTRYLPVEVEVAMRSRSGRDELGYYAPLIF